MGNYRRAGRTQPDHALTGRFLDQMKRKYVHKLCDCESGNGTGNDHQALAQYYLKGSLHIRHAPGNVLHLPPIGRGKPYGQEDHEKSITDQPDGEKRQQAYPPLAVVFIDDICHHKYDRPEQHPRRKLQRPFPPEEVKIPGGNPQSAFKCKNFDPNELGNQGVRYEEPAQKDKKPRRAVGDNILCQGKVFANPFFC